VTKQEFVDRIADKAVVLFSDGTPRANAQAAANHTARVGVLVRVLTVRQCRAPGMAPSREKAKICRLLDVRLARPQKNMAPMMIASMSFAPVGLPASSRIRVAPYHPSQKESLLEIAAAARGSIYIMAEELGHDVEFTAVDELYRDVGLRRTRHVWLAYRVNKDEPIGAAIAYRGPLGVNFSYLENRCDLLLHPTLPEAEVSEAASALLTACAEAYDDFELEEIPVIAEEMATHVLYKLGAEFLRHYCQGIWLKDGHPRFYRHVDGFYTKLLARMEKQELQAALVGQEK